MATHDPGKMHRDIAVQLLADAAEFMPESPIRATLLAEAQVHATLAHSEEQRTANLAAVFGAGKYVGPLVTEQHDDHRRAEQNAIAVAFVADHRERLRNRVGLA